MSEHERFISLLHMPNGDRAVLLLTFGLTILVDLTMAIAVGVTLASLLFMMRMSEAVQIETGNGATQDDGDGDGDGDETEDIHQRDALPEGVEVFRIDGPLFFAIANELLDTLRRVGPMPQVIILRMKRVPLLDASGATTIAEVVHQAGIAGAQIILSGTRAQPITMLERLQLGPRSGRVIYIANYTDALRIATTIIEAKRSCRNH
jgi:SulP family sulfate permease